MSGATEKTKKSEQVSPVVLDSPHGVGEKTSVSHCSHDTRTVNCMSQFETALTTYRSFTDRFQSIVIGTVSEDGIPNASYVPFVMDENKNIYLYVSGLATHTQNLHTVPKVSVLFIEDESQTQQIFARNRLTFDCTATLVERDTVFWHQIVELFEARFGEIIQLFRDLPDFRIFQLTPTKGRFVIGFGAAYDVDPNDFNNLVHVSSTQR